MMVGFGVAHQLFLRWEEESRSDEAEENGGESFIEALGTIR